MSRRWNARLQARNSHFYRHGPMLRTVRQFTLPDGLQQLRRPHAVALREQPVRRLVESQSGLRSMGERDEV